MAKAYLYSTERSFYLKLLTYLLLISIFSFFPLTFIFGISTYISMLLIIPCAFLFIYGLINSFFDTKIDAIGEIIFNNNCIQLSYFKGETKEFTFNNLSKIIFEYRGYDGRNDSTLFNPFLISGGLNNEIIIYQNNGNRFHIDFYIDSIRTMKDIVYTLKKVDNLKIEIIESNTRKRIYKNY